MFHFFFCNDHIHYFILDLFTDLKKPVLVVKLGHNWSMFIIYNIKIAPVLLQENDCVSLSFFVGIYLYFSL